MMWKKLCITACAVFCAVLAAAPCALAEDASADSSASSGASSDSSLLGDAGELHDSVSSNFSDGVDHVAGTLEDTPGALSYNVKDQFPQFIKAALDFVPLPFWWVFEFGIILGFVNALYRRMS